MAPVAVAEHVLPDWAMEVATAPVEKIGVVKCEKAFLHLPTQPSEIVEKPLEYMAVPAVLEHYCSSRTELQQHLVLKTIMGSD